MNNNVFYVINEDGIRVDAKALSKFKINNKNYITYTFNEINSDQMIKIYVSGITFDGVGYSYSEIATDQEWNDIKTVLKMLAKNEEESFPDTIASDFKILGEEISIRKPKKLLVSTKFANTIGLKFDEEVAKAEPVQLEMPVEKVNFEEKEPEIEKTIKIPTFEELQTRNKNIQSAMSTVTETSPVSYAPKEPKAPTYESRVRKVNYEEKFKKDVEPVLLDVYAQQQKHIEELEEELSKTKFDLFEKQKEALSLSNEKEQIEKKTIALEQQLDGVQRKMNGILSVLQDK